MIPDVVQLIGALLTIITAIIISYFTWYYQQKLFNKEQKRRRLQIKRNQLSLLNSLYIELNVLVGPNILCINGKDYPVIGNLQWYKNSIAGLVVHSSKPAHSIWKINTLDYVTHLHNKIDNQDVVELKKLIILLNQKTEMIETHFDSGCTDSVYLSEVIEETIDIVKIAREFIITNFGLQLNLLSEV